MHNNPLLYLDQLGLFSLDFSTLFNRESLVNSKITYCDDFEERYPDYESSRIYDLSDLGLPEPPGGLRYVYGNGMNNTFEEARKNALYISELIGGYNVHGVFNGTHGKVNDVKECIMGLNNIATKPVRLHQELWSTLLKEMPTHVKIFNVAHSQDVIHVTNGLVDFPPDLQQRLLFVAIAPGGYIDPKTCADVFHYRAKAQRDFVPRLDKAGIQRAQGTIVDLKSHPKAPWHDHPFMSPTYRKPLKQHLDSYNLSKGTSL